jgi:hypothetical protein
VDNGGFKNGLIIGGGGGGTGAVRESGCDAGVAYVLHCVDELTAAERGTLSPFDPATYLTLNGSSRYCIAAKDCAAAN